jgi:mono/diheme cytochrome c family protein
MTRTCNITSLIILVCFAGGCEPSDPENTNYDYRMVVQPRYNTFQPSGFWEDRQSARPLVANTVPINGRANVDTNEAVRSERPPELTTIPIKLTQQDLVRGQQQFNVYCAVCHGRLGDGNGMIAQRGFTKPPSFYLPRLRQAPPGHIYNVITYGYGAMYSYNERVGEADRWRIAAYIRALQLSAPGETGTERGGVAPGPPPNTSLEPSTRPLQRQ